MKVSTFILSIIGALAWSTELVSADINRKEYACCMTDSTKVGTEAEFCAKDCKGTDKDNCDDYTKLWQIRNGEDRPNHCRAVVCCEQANCGGMCTEDYHTAPTCMNSDPGMYVCDENTPLNQGKIAIKCCNDACEWCHDWRGFFFINPSDTGFCEATFPTERNRLRECPSFDSCCVNGCEALCQKFEQTYERCVKSNQEPNNPNWVLTPCGTVSVGGDPHVQLWNHTWYDFHGACDLVYLNAPDFQNGLGLSIHIRTTRRYEYSFISQAAVRIGDDILEVSSFGEYALNKVSHAELPNALSGYAVSLEEVNDKARAFTVDFGYGEGIVIQTFKDLVNVQFVNANNLIGSTGLLGEFGTGKMLARDGVTVIEDPALFGQEWQVRSNEAMLFQTVRVPQHPEGCNMPSPKDKAEVSRHRRLGEQVITRDTAENACSHLSGSRLKNCVYDVLASGDVEVAQAGPY